MRWTPYVTVAAIIQRDDKFLLVKENINNQIVYNQPAGHWEDNETLSEAVIREVMEETAWQFKIEFITGIYQWKHPSLNKTFLRFTFAGTVGNFQPQRKLDKEIIETVWLNLEEIKKLGPQLRSPQVILCIEDYLAGKQFSPDLLSVVMNNCN